jgi:hypothetical protein
MGVHGANIGHLMFDEFLPWFTLLKMFGLEPLGHQMQPLNWNIRTKQNPDERLPNTGE